MNFQAAVIQRDQSQATAATAYFPAFDYLRIIVAVGVFASHAHDLGNFGNACVQIFFALSGFLIGGILLRSDKMGLPRFYFNRSTRIWIPYGIATLLLFVVTALKQSLADLKPWEFFFYDVTFVYNWFGPPQLATSMSRMPLNGAGNHFWSICVEEQFYLLAPFVLLFVNRWLSVFVLVAVFILNFFYPQDFAAIALGVLLAISREQFGDWYLKPRTLATVCLVAAGSVLLMDLDVVAYARIFPLIAVCIIAVLAFEGRPDAVSKTLGGMSFSFYLNHWIGFFAAHALLKPMGASLAWSAGLALALLMSWLHYLYVDRAIARHRSAYFTVRRGRLACALGFSLVAIGLAVGSILTR